MTTPSPTMEAKVNLTIIKPQSPSTFPPRHIAMNIIRKAMAFLACTIFATGLSKAAQISVGKGSTEASNYSVCEIDGTIDDGDVSNFINAIESNCTQALISSDGGNIAATMRIGRIIRTRKIGVVIQGKCQSACILLYAAGVSRMNLGTIEIHRPYFQVNTESFEKTQRRYEILSQEIREYLNSMNVSERLFEAMMQTPPNQFRVLSKAELSSFGLTSQDPVYSEYVENFRAASSGLTKGQWTQRKEQVTGKCRGFFAAEPPPPNAKAVLDCWKKEFPQFFTPLK